MATAHTEYLARLVSWAQSASSVRGVLVMGSVAQIGTEDALSDLDVMLITTRPRELRRGGWLDEIGPRPILSWTYRSPIGRQIVRQVVYDGPLVVDIATTSWTQAALTGATITAIARLPWLRRAFGAPISTQLEAWLQITRRGTRVLLDKDGIATRMAASIDEVSIFRPSEAEFLNTVHSLFGLLLWQSKQLVRRELWMALATVGQQVEDQLLVMLQWHAATSPSEAKDTWYGGRHIEQWLDPRLSASLPKIWLGYDVYQAWAALVATLDLFSLAAQEVAHRSRFRYPTDDERQLRTWLSERQPEPTRSDAP
jgi:aminoglycoside 6-adenylyltransferase